MYITRAYYAALGNRLFGGVTSGLSANIATYYFALFTVAPGSDGTGGTECTGTSYARVSATNNTTNFPTISAGQTKASGAAITFPSPGANDWGTIKAIGIYDASTSGNLLFWVVIPDSTPTSGNAPNIPLGLFQFTMT